MAIIDFDYWKTMWLVDDINDLGDNINSEIKRMQKHLSNVAKEWKGPASDAYQKYLEELIADMISAKSKIYSLANKVKNAAEKIKNDEERIAENIGNAGGGSAGGGGSSRKF